jgi:multidrug resistance efflux pump
MFYAGVAKKVRKTGNMVRVLNLSSSINQLQTQLAQWEQNYLLTSPIDGVVTLTKYWQKNQNVAAGEVLATVAPQHKTKIIGNLFSYRHLACVNFAGLVSTLFVVVQSVGYS